MKRFDRRKDESKAAPGNVQSVVMSRTHLPKEETPGVKIQKARVFRVGFDGVSVSEVKPIVSKLFKTKRMRSKSGRKKVQQGAEYAGQYLFNCGRCGGLFKCNNRTSCSVDTAKEEFMVLCAHCKKELVLYRSMCIEINEVLRQMDDGN